ncbi:unnamed protein product [Protopolystoma xenopodis]|uniref:Uncharacterized protein n=1 Tax=Protopolystoma xenopodis TaxID=117903 RepID=A0A3S5CIM7_9PLAT|nr:unnamed protein product [Protopolystoma xenopodis]
MLLRKGTFPEVFSSFDCEPEEALKRIDNLKEMPSTPYCLDNQRDPVYSAIPYADDSHLDVPLTPIRCPENHAKYSIDAYPSFKNLPESSEVLCIHDMQKDSNELDYCSDDFSPIRLFPNANRSYPSLACDFEQLTLQSKHANVDRKTISSPEDYFSFYNSSLKHHPLTSRDSSSEPSLSIPRDRDTVPGKSTDKEEAMPVEAIPLQSEFSNASFTVHRWLDEHGFLTTLSPQRSLPDTTWDNGDTNSIRRSSGGRLPLSGLQETLSPHYFESTLLSKAPSSSAISSNLTHLPPGQANVENMPPSESKMALQSDEVISDTSLFASRPTAPPGYLFSPPTSTDTVSLIQAPILSADWALAVQLLLLLLEPSHRLRLQILEKYFRGIDEACRRGHRDGSIQVQ